MIKISIRKHIVYKRIFKIAAAAAVLLVIAGIFVGISMKLRAQDDETCYRERIASKENFRIHGKKLYYVETDPDDFYPNYAEFLPERNIYKDNDDQYYYFDPYTQNIRTISNESPVRPAGLSDQNSIIADAKKRISEWYDEDHYQKSLEDFEWFIETYQLDNAKSVEMVQVVNADISLLVSNILYSADGVFEGAWIHLDSIISDEDVGRIIPKQDAIAKAESFLEKEYQKTDWAKINTRPVAGDEGNYWEVKCEKSNEFLIVEGYIVAVDMFTGEAKLTDTLK